MRTNAQFYESQSENSAYAAFLVKAYANTHTMSKKMIALPSRVLMVETRKGPVLYNVEDEITGGGFMKWTNNAGNKKPDTPREVVGLSKWTHDATEGYMMLTDMQGVETSEGIVLTDPAILCRDTKRFSPTNLGPPAMKMCLDVLRGTPTEPSVVRHLGHRTIRMPGIFTSDARTMRDLGRRLLSSAGSGGGLDSAGSSVIVHHKRIEKRRESAEAERMERKLCTERAAHQEEEKKKKKRALEAVLLLLLLNRQRFE